MSAYCTPCSLSLLADSSHSCLLIHLGISQCSLGINSGLPSVVCALVCSSRIAWEKPTITALGFRLGLCLSLEFLSEWNVVEERPRVVELVIPRPLEIAHGLEHAVQLFVAYEGQEGGWDSGFAGGAWGIVGRGVSEDAFWLAGSWMIVSSLLLL
jgi:hypothetical protein